jgi:hypothetical protein
VDDASAKLDIREVRGQFADGIETGAINMFVREEENHIETGTDVEFLFKDGGFTGSDAGDVSE